MKSDQFFRELGKVINEAVRDAVRSEIKKILSEDFQPQPERKPSRSSELIEEMRQGMREMGESVKNQTTYTPPTRAKHKPNPKNMLFGVEVSMDPEEELNKSVLDEAHTPEVTNLFKKDFGAILKRSKEISSGVMK